ncbi:MAG: pirin family protein [Jatrophihabitantaceae bacterium]
MSNLETAPRLTRCGGLADVAARPVHELFAGRSVQLGVGDGTVVRRLLPNLGRRLVGAWCFVDHYGPNNISNAPGIQVPPHPHIGLQTVSWLLDGEVHHRDSIGSDQLIRPGELGLMTAGRGIAHAEHSPLPHAAMLHAVQLWVALPDGSREVAPTWQHESALPTLVDGGLSATVIMGSLDSAHSPGQTYSPLVGADLTLLPGGDGTVALETDFEYAVLAMSGSVEIENANVEVGSMLYLGCGRRELRLKSDAGARVLLLGGEPFDEQIVMWWNFVARTDEQIRDVREQWMTGTQFGAVADAGERMPAPPLPPGRLKPGGSERHQQANREA